MLSWIFYITRGKGTAGQDAPSYCCAACHELLSDASEQVEVLGRPARRTYVNPHGVQCEIVTVSACRSYAPASYSSAEDTWFEGWAWRPLGCGACRSFLGWRFEATAEGVAGPRRFYGLLVDRLVIV